MEATNFPYSIITLRIPIIIGTQGIAVKPVTNKSPEKQMKFSPHLLHVRKEDRKSKHKKRSSLALTSPFGLMVGNKVGDISSRSESEIPKVFSFSRTGSSNCKHYSSC